jgi:hypothetical protein
MSKVIKMEINVIVPKTANYVGINRNGSVFWSTEPIFPHPDMEHFVKLNNANKSNYKVSIVKANSYDCGNGYIKHWEKTCCKIN